MIDEKHAYLIMAHNNYYTLEKLVRMLDNEKNDIFIHIDKKAKNINKEKLKNVTQKSKIEIIESIDVRWGDYSQVKCELLLLEQAIRGKYAYYHLLSGNDLPIKTQEYIHDFFKKNHGKEFLHFEGKKISNNKREWISKYHILQRYTFISNYKLINKIIKSLEKIILKIQNILKINRYDNSYIIQSGANWFSITHDLAEYVLSRKEWIQKNFKSTRSADEIFLQTIVVNSTFADNLYYKGFDNDYIGCMRYIDWTRGNPYVFKNKDFNELINSEYLWARKFDENKDREIIDKIYNYITEK